MTEPVKAKPLAAGRREIRVFISSTFRDMQEEREELVKQVFPQLRRLCESRGVTWGEVDLRWGVSDEAKAEGKVLPLCLAEIEHCRPYFIGLLGERYGSPYLPVCQVSDSDSCTMQNDRLSYPACISNDRLNSR